MTRSWLLLLLAAYSLSGEVTITYLANEGVMVLSGSTKVLIDALFRDSLDDYVRHDSPTQERLESGKPPFDGIVLGLATHYHLDHWDAGAISRFLRLNPAAMFASTPQATGMIPRSLRQRVKPLWPGTEGSVPLEVAGVHVEAFPLEHGKTQNLGLLVSMGERDVLHLGDAEPIAVNFERLRTRKRPDVALVPFWWLLEENSRSFVVRQWQPRHVVALHLGAGDARARAAEIRKAVPGAWIGVQPGESRKF